MSQALKPSTLLIAQGEQSLQLASAHQAGLVRR